MYLAANRNRSIRYKNEILAVVKDQLAPVIAAEMSAAIHNHTFDNETELTARVHHLESSGREIQDRLSIIEVYLIL